MKAMRVTEFGGPERLELHDVERPVPGPGEALVRLACAGVNFIDIYMRNGSYAKSATYKTPLPMTIGMEGAGTVAALGPGVTGLDVGARVGYCLARGSYAEYAVVPAWRLARIPDDVADPVATTLMLQGCTAHYLTHSAFPLGPEHSCLVLTGGAAPFPRGLGRRAPRHLPGRPPASRGRERVRGQRREAARHRVLRSGAVCVQRDWLPPAPTRSAPHAESGAPLPPSIGRAWRREPAGGP